MKNKMAIAALVALCGTAAQAQDTVYWPAPQNAAQHAATSYFPMGTPLTLTTRTQISTKENKPGDRVYLEVAESLSYQGQIVVPAGSVAVGEVAQVQKNGHFGKKGKLGLHLLYVETPNGPVRLSGRAYDEGTSGTITSVATIAFVSVLGFLVHGTSANIPAGSVVNAYLADDLRFTKQASPSQVAMTQARPDQFQPATQADEARALPASFDPTVFANKAGQAARR